jgi:hypothetical protein
MLALRINRINGDWDPYWKAPNSAAANDNSPQKSLRLTLRSRLVGGGFKPP